MIGMVALDRGMDSLAVCRADLTWLDGWQGFAFVGWSTAQKAGWLKGFIDATPKDHFNVIDMGYSGQGEWQKWDDASFFGAKFIVRRERSCLTKLMAAKIDRFWHHSFADSSSAL